MVRDGLYRRDDSPGYRSRSRSPRAPRGRSRSPSYSRSRSPRGPPISRRGGSPGFAGGGGGRGPRGPPPPGRRASPPFRTYSRSPSRSRSRSPSSEEPGQIRTAPAAHRRQGKQRGPDPEAAAQLQALRGQLEAEQAARAAAEGRLEFLKGKVRDVAERSKSRGNMLAQLTLAVRVVADAKQQLAEAEGQLQQVLAAAEAYLQDDVPAAPAKRADEGSSGPQAGAAQQQHEHQQHAVNGQVNAAAGAGQATAAAVDDDAAADAGTRQAGGWIEATPAGGQGSPAAGHLQNLKFKLKL